MPRKTSNSRRSLFSTAPVRRPAAYPPARSGSVSRSGSVPSMKDSVKQGFGLGLGLEGARAAVGTVAGVFSSDKQQPLEDTQASAGRVGGDSGNVECGLEKKVYEKCLDDTGNLDNQCYDLFQIYERCSSRGV